MSIVGLDVKELDTPTLLLDLDVMQRNISHMAEYYKGVKTDLRPHIKPHKCPIIAHKQIEAGAIGVTCQKLGEAEVMANAGIKNILIANQIANEQKIKRLIGLAQHSDVIIGVDNIRNAEQISFAASAKGLKVNTLMEVSGGRCGVEAGKPSLLLAKELVKLNGLNFKGIWFHKGLGSFKEINERRRVHFELLKPVIDTKDMIEDAGIDVEIVSSGATSTYNITPDVPGVTEAQPGKYIFMDRVVKNLEGMEHFNYALSILTTVISRPSRDRAIIDVGLKSRGGNYGALIPPLVKDMERVEVIRFSAEHGHVKLDPSHVELDVGDKIELIPSNCGTTANIYNEYVGVRGGLVEVIWPILARGRAQ